MQRRCDHPFKNRISMAPCCESSKFPYSPEVLKRCSAEATYNMYLTPAHLWNPGGVATGGIKFSKESISVPSQDVNSTSINPIEPTIKAIIVEYDSTQMFSLSYAEMDKFFNQVVQDAIRKYFWNIYFCEMYIEMTKTDFFFRWKVGCKNS